MPAPSQLVAALLAHPGSDDCEPGGWRRLRSLKSAMSRRDTFEEGRLWPRSNCRNHLGHDSSLLRMKRLHRAGHANQSRFAKSQTSQHEVCASPPREKPQSPNGR